MLKNPPESVVLHTESVVQHGGDIVLSAGQGMVSVRPSLPRSRERNIQGAAGRVHHCLPGQRRSRRDSTTSLGLYGTPGCLRNCVCEQEGVIKGNPPAGSHSAETLAPCKAAFSSSSGQSCAGKLKLVPNLPYSLKRSEKISYRRRPGPTHCSFQDDMT